ncbi:DUF2076 domain-containing protein [soil metagenome]
MTPQERQLVDDLFDRLAGLETSPRDPNANAAIAEGLRRAPNAVYALVQTVLVQDEALRRADARIQELEGGAQQQPSGGFLDSMRGAILGSGQSRGSVPSVRPGDSAQRGPVWNSGQALEQADGRMGGDPRMNADPRMNDPRAGNPGGGLFGGGGGSFLGTAAATAAGVIGGSMLMNSIRGMMGGGSQQSFGNTAESGGSKTPWDSKSSDNLASGNLARDAGVNDVGKSGNDSQRQSSYDQAQADADQDQDQDQDDDDDYDSADLDDGDSDFA